METIDNLILYQNRYDAMSEGDDIRELAQMVLKIIVSEDNSNSSIEEKSEIIMAGINALDKLSQKVMLIKNSYKICLSDIANSCEINKQKILDIKMKVDKLNALHQDGTIPTLTNTLDVDNGKFLIKTSTSGNEIFDSNIKFEPDLIPYTFDIVLTKKLEECQNWCEILFVLIDRYNNKFFNMFGDENHLIECYTELRSYFDNGDIENIPDKFIECLSAVENMSNVINSSLMHITKFIVSISHNIAIIDDICHICSNSEIMI